MTTDSLKAALEPCPSGHRKIEVGYDDEAGQHFIACSGEPSCRWAMYGETLEGTVAAWNLRASTDAAGDDAGNLRAIVGLFVAKAMVAKWSGGQNSRVRHIPESEIERLGAALSAQAPVEPVVKPRPYPFAVDGMKSSETLIVEGASLTIHTSGHTDEEGRGYFCFCEDECETEYGENGKSYWISYTTNSELIAIRDKLNEIFPAAFAQPPAAEPVTGIDLETAAWAWLEKKFGTESDDPVDRDYDASEMVDAFHAGFGHRPSALATGNGGEGRSLAAQTALSTRADGAMGDALRWLRKQMVREQDIGVSGFEDWIERIDAAFAEGKPNGQ